MSTTSTKRVALVVGGSRGIGRQIAIDLARDGYAVVVAGKSTSTATANTAPFPPDPNSSASTIDTVVREIREAGGEALAAVVDVRDFEQVKAMLELVERTYTRLDVLVYNSGAIWWSSIPTTPMKRFQLMQRVNPEGLYGTIQSALPLFAKNGYHGRIVVVSPPIYSRFFRGKAAYAMGKVGMSVLTKGLAMDFEREGWEGMAVTSLWPATAIESAATQKLRTGTGDSDGRQDLRRATIFSDAILAILKAPVKVVNGLLDLDEDFLRKHAGVSDFSKYSIVDGATPRRIMPAVFPDLTVAEQDDEGTRIDSSVRGRSKI
ncbi:MAG: hypothetical protein M4579_003683 [Chaenotheca gracillima]|nr:MAG: hypothetical protein M4579_003683 [Chaenotheca gracillima]